MVCQERRNAISNCGFVRRLKPASSTAKTRLFEPPVRGDPGLLPTRLNRNTRAQELKPVVRWGLDCGMSELIPRYTTCRFGFVGSYVPESGPFDGLRAGFRLPGNVVRVCSASGRGRPHDSRPTTPASQRRACRGPRTGVRRYAGRSEAGSLGSEAVRAGLGARLA